MGLPMSTKTDQIKAFLEHSNLSSREIADAVGCSPDYVRAIRQRLIGGGTSAADKKYLAAFVARHGVHRNTHRYRTDTEYRARHNAYRRPRSRARQEA